MLKPDLSHNPADLLCVKPFKKISCTGSHDKGEKKGGLERRLRAGQGKARLSSAQLQEYPACSAHSVL